MCPSRKAAECALESSEVAPINQKKVTTHHPPLNAREDPAPLHTANIQPRSPRLEIFPHAYSPVDGVPALLRGGLGGQ
jgi:hypothetical protein